VLTVTKASPALFTAFAEKMLTNYVSASKRDTNVAPTTPEERRGEEINQDCSVEKLEKFINSDI